MRAVVLALVIATAPTLALTATAQQIPSSRDKVAHPDGDLPGDPRIALVKVAENFNDPVNVTNAGDSSGRIFVVERVGRVKVVDRDGNVQDEPFLDLTRLLPWASAVQTGLLEQGLYAIAFHPNFAENGHFFVHYASLPLNGDGLIMRFTVDPESPDVVSPERARETGRSIMQIPQPWYNHNGGEIAFGPDGYLYIATGDGGYLGGSTGADPQGLGQSLSTMLGKILRIDVDIEEARYHIPADNPFARAADELGAEPETWSYGLRNPYQFVFDPETGDLFITDVGQNHWEEINWQPTDSGGGENYGWSRMEASFCHPITGDPEEQDCPVVGVLPAAQYPHRVPYPGAEELQESWGCAAQGLGVANYGGMEGVMLVGDWCSGRVFGLGWDEQAGRWQLEELLQTDLQFTAGGYDEDNNVLAVNCNCSYGQEGPTTNPPGALWRIVPADEVPEGAEVVRTVQ